MIKYTLILLVPMMLISQSLFYISDKDSRSYDLFKLNMNTKKRLKITHHPSSGHYPHFNHPKLSPDGKHILIQADPGSHDRYQIWLLKIDGTDLKKISKKEGLYPNWKADATGIYYSGRRNGIWEIFYSDIKGNKEENLSKNYKSDNPPGWGATMTASRDGKYLLYTYIREKRLYRMDLRNGKSTALTKEGESYAQPNFSHDGKRIAVNKKNGKKYDLVIFDFNTLKSEVIVENVYSYYGMSWSKDDKEILYTSDYNGEASIYKVNIKSKKSMNITEDGAFNTQAIWAANQ